MNLTAQKGSTASEITNETPSRGGAWIGQRKQPIATKKSATKLFPRVTHGFDNANNP